MCLRNSSEAHFSLFFRGNTRYKSVLAIDFNYGLHANHAPSSVLRKTYFSAGNILGIIFTKALRNGFLSSVALDIAACTFST